MIKTFSTATIILSHGSQDPVGILEFKKAFKIFESLTPQSVITYGFLELTSPTISDALTYVTQFPITSITLIQSFLLHATHTQNDIPGILKHFSHQHPNYPITLSKPLCSNPRVPELIQSAIEAVEHTSQTLIPRENTHVIFVGRGTSVPSANSWSFEVAQQLQSIMKFGRISVAFAASVDPKLQKALEQAFSAKPQRIIIVPLLLWSGALYQQIIHRTQLGQTQQPDIEWLCTPPLGTHPLLPHIWQDLARVITE